MSIEPPFTCPICHGHGDSCAREWHIGLICDPCILSLPDDELWIADDEWAVANEPPSDSDWKAIANDLAAALDSFMAYDGYGQGGADDSNRGDWRAAERAIDRYRSAQ